MSRRMERCAAHGLPPGRCPVRSCPHYDGGARNFRIGKPELARCRRCKRKVPVKELEQNGGFCAAECETSTIRIGHRSRRPDPVKAFDRDPKKESA